MRTRHTKRVVLGAAALSLLFAGSAFTAGNTLPGNHAAGVGSTDVSGVKVGSMAYDLNESRDTVNGVTFGSVTDSDGGALSGSEKAEVSVDMGTGYEAWETCSVTVDTIACSGDDFTSKDFNKVVGVRLVVTDGEFDTEGNRVTVETDTEG